MTRTERSVAAASGAGLPFRAAVPVDDPFRLRIDEVPETGTWVTIVDPRHANRTRPVLLPVRRGRRYVPGPSLSLDERTFRDTARRLVGDAPVDLVAEHEPRDDARGDYWSALVAYIRTATNAHPEVAVDPILRRAVFDAVVAAVLVVFPVTTPRSAHDDAVEALPASLRRAIHYMQAHLADGVTVEEIAQEARLSVRGLQAAFRRHLDRTPLEHLRILRVLAAHEELIAADSADGTRIEEVALRWGFSSSGRFAAAYRQEFGVLPSVTLRR